MSPRYKLSPAFIAMLLKDKAKVSSPDQGRSDTPMGSGDRFSAMRSAESDFTPLEEILGGRPAPVPPPASATASPPAPARRPEPMLNLPRIEDVWRQMQAAKQRLATAHNAIGSLHRPSEVGMITPASVARPTGFQFGNLGGSAAGRHDFSSSFPSGKYDELSALGGLAPDAWAHGPARRHDFGQGLQFAENQSASSRAPDWRSFAVDQGSSGYPSNFAANVGTILGQLSPSKIPKFIRQPQAAPDVLSPQYRAMARAIQKGEGHDYESHNTGTVRGAVIHSLNYNPRGKVTGKTVNQIFATENLPQTNKNRLFAFGPYGITFDALRVAVRDLGLTGNERMTPEMQDRIFAHSLIRRDLKRFLDDPKIGVDQAQYSAARQWASIAVPRNYPTGKFDAKRRPIISDGTMSYYGSGNNANMDATRDLRRALESWHLPAARRGGERRTTIGQ